MWIRNCIVNATTDVLDPTLQPSLMDMNAIVKSSAEITASTINNPSTWNSPIIIGAIFAILAVIVGIPSAILALKTLQSRKRNKQGKSIT